MTLLKRTPIPTLAETAYDILAAAIFDQQLKPNDPLNIDELARQLDMSNTPIREAMTRATIEGLVRKETNKGYKVAPLLTADEYRQLFQMRMILEEFAIKNAQQWDFDILRMAYQKMDSVKHGKNYVDYKERAKYDQLFHSTLVDAAGNIFVSQAWRNLNFHHHIFRLRRFDSEPGEHFKRHSTVTEHALILQHLKANNIEAAAKAVIQHMENAQKSILPLRQGI